MYKLTNSNLKKNEYQHLKMLNNFKVIFAAFSILLSASFPCNALTPISDNQFLADKCEYHIDKIRVTDYYCKNEIHKCSANLEFFIKVKSDPTLIRGWIKRIEYQAVCHNNNGKGTLDLQKVVKYAGDSRFLDSPDYYSIKVSANIFTAPQYYCDYKLGVDLLLRLENNFGESFFLSLHHLNRDDQGISFDLPHEIYDRFGLNPDLHNLPTTALDPHLYFLNPKSCQ